MRCKILIGNSASRVAPSRTVPPEAKPLPHFLRPGAVGVLLIFAPALLAAHRAFVVRPPRQKPNFVFRAPESARDRPSALSTLPHRSSFNPFPWATGRRIAPLGRTGLQPSLGPPRGSLGFVYWMAVETPDVARCRILHPPDGRCRMGHGFPAYSPISNETRVPAAYLDSAEGSFLAFLPFCRMNNLRRASRGE